MAKVTIDIVTWNSMRDLPDCLRSIDRQTFRDFSLTVIDNGSQDGVHDFLRSTYPRVGLITNRRNLGYARAHNQGFHVCRSEYVLAMNPDVTLTSTFLQRLLEAFSRARGAGSAGGKVLRPPKDPTETERPTLDSAGLLVLKNRRVLNRGEGEEDRGQYDRSETVFGFSGALACYRLPALRDVSIALPGQFAPEFFDEDFFAYKEDVDLAWRMNLRGWQHLFVPEAVAFHRRSAQGGETSDTLVAKYRRKKSQVVNAFSYKNHLQLLLKNERVGATPADVPVIFFYEAKKFLYLLFAEPRTLHGLLAFFRQLPRMLAKRRLIQRSVRVSRATIRSWF